MPLTVADLIRVLQELPGHKPVHVVGRYVRLPQVGGARFDLHDDDATEAQDAVYNGTFVLIRG